MTSPRLYSSNNPFLQLAENEESIDSLRIDTSSATLGQTSDITSQVSAPVQVVDPQSTTSSNIPSIHVIDPEGIETESIVSPTTPGSIPPPLPPFPSNYPRRSHSRTSSILDNNDITSTVSRLSIVEDEPVSSSITNEESITTNTSSAASSSTDTNTNTTSNDNNANSAQSETPVVSDSDPSENTRLYGSQQILLTPDELRAQMEREDQELVAALPPSPNYTALPSPGEISLPNNHAIDPATINDNPPDEEPPAYTEMSEDVAPYVMRPQFSATGGDEMSTRINQGNSRYRRPEGPPPQPTRPPQRPARPPHRPDRPQRPAQALPQQQSPNSGRVYTRPSVPPPGHQQGHVSQQQMVHPIYAPPVRPTRPTSSNTSTTSLLSPTVSPAVPARPSSPSLPPR